ncbi:MAG: hypothetical protein K0U76_17335 [Actinomycetia bacterium]|nr:hypothetical protein [Actinomycetes bacterium]MCH9703113.1 hypothetical protein [Actinomycetes bacterium]MCH9760045.1 hypothetical protein [Actinomycetes bacterium]
MYRTITAAALTALLAIASPFAMPFTAAAQPDPELPDPFFIPGDVLGDALGDSGSFDYQLNLIESPPPATTDARGVIIGSNASGAQPLQGLPGSRLGNEPRSETTNRVQALVAVGDIRPAAAGAGPTVSAGPSQTKLEHPTGQPPTASATGIEPVAPVDPNAPMTPLSPLEEEDSG